MKNLNWLPDKKWYEFAYHKFFNPEVKYEDWMPWDEWDYPERDILRFSKIIKDQSDHIKNSKVLDLACHLGYISLFCLHNNAKWVTGTNVRDFELSIAKDICTKSGYENFEFINSDLNDLTQLRELANTHDTIMLPGVLYHLNNHYQVLETLCNSKAKKIIIESRVLPELEIDTPMVEWGFEENESTSGFYNNISKVCIGTPNTNWILQILNFFDREVIYNQKISYKKPNGNIDHRVIITAV